MSEAPTYKSYVWGVEVDFSSDAIKKVLGLKSVRFSEPGYHQRVNGDPDYDGIARDICMENSEWEGNDKNKYKYLKRVNLTPEAKGCGKLKEIEPRELKEIETNPPSFFPQFITLAPIVAAVGSLLAPPPSRALRTSSLSSLASPFVEDLSLHLLRRRHRCLSSHCCLGELRAAIKAPRSTSTNLISVRGTIERYKKASAASSNTESVSEANTQFYQQESSKLRRQIRDIQNLNRHILGEALSSLSLKELKNLESRLEKGLSRVRSRKVLFFYPP
ncbi:uncharacterized protein [Arachis hypogaea]|uniref:uncharacterized protein n=1 Tax=Arachis hypogaea TaxID=3818 RepID=UPI003B216F66